MELTGFLFIVGTAVVILAVLLVSRRGQRSLEKKFGEIREQMCGDLQKINLDLAERIVKASGDTRQELTDRLSEYFPKMEKEISGRLAEGARQQTEGLEVIRTRVDERLKEIGEKVQSKLDENIKEGFIHFEKVQEHLKSAEKQLRSVGELGESVNELNSLLKMPHLRGSFGETTLERILSDFLPAHMFEIEAQIGSDSMERVDAVVFLPEAKLPIDSKFPREQIAALFEENGGTEKTKEDLRRIMLLEAKRITKYIRPEKGTTEMAMIFLPSETLYFEVIRNAELCKELYKFQVFPVSPNTLAVMLKAIASSYSYYKIAQNIKKTIEDIHKARKQFSNFEGKFDNIGNYLSKAQESYRVAGTHLDRYSGSVLKLTGDGDQVKEIEAD